MTKGRPFALLVGIYLLLTLVALPLMSACSSPAPSPTPSQAPKPAVLPSPAAITPSLPPTSKPTPTAAAADYYKGKSLDLTLSEGPGTDLDLTGRLLALYLKKYADINAVVTNRVGAGGMEGLMWVYNARPDGLTVGGSMLGTLTLNKINAAPGANYEVEKFSYLLGVGEVKRLFFVSSKGPYQTLAALQAAKDLKLAATSLAGGIASATVSSAFLANLDAKVVTGFTYAGAELSIMQGQTAGLAVTSGTVLGLVKEGRAKALFVIDRERDSLLPDVPAITELVTLDTAEKKDLVELFHEMRSGVGLFTSPGVPADRVEYLNQVFQKITADPQFRAELDKVYTFHVQVYQPSKELEKNIATLMKLGTGTKSLLQRLLKTYTIAK